MRESQQQLLDTNLVLERLIKSDGLTGLANRRYFDEYLEIEWKRALREQSELSLLMIDVVTSRPTTTGMVTLRGMTYCVV